MAEALKPLSRLQVRSVDERAIREYGMLGLVLMENAGRGAAEWLHRLAPPDAKLTILAGLGNNGGDGFVIARHWELLRGKKARIYVVSASDENFESKMSADAAANFSILRRAGFTMRIARGRTSELDSDLSTSDVVVDAILGTGAKRDLREPIRSIVEAANATKAVRVAVDIPTGLDCDNGETSGVCFQAHHTLTFVASKIGFRNPLALQYIGQIHVIDIGVPRVLLDQIARDDA